MAVVEMMNQHLTRPEADTRRVWIESGHMIELSKTAVLRLYVDRCGERYIPKVEINRHYRNGMQSHYLELQRGCWLDLIHICGVMAIPRAMEYSRDGSVRRILMEFLKTDAKLSWAL